MHAICLYKSCKTSFGEPFTKAISFPSRRWMVLIRFRRASNALVHAWV